MTYCNLINLTNAILSVTTNGTPIDIKCQDVSMKQLCNNIDITFENITSNYVNITNVLHNSLDNILNCNGNFTDYKPKTMKFTLYNFIFPIIITTILMIVYMITKYTMTNNKKKYLYNKKDITFDYFINFDRKHKVV